METIFKIWKEKEKIMEGIKNRIFKKEHIEEVAKKRWDVCKSCNYVDYIGGKCAVPGTAPCCKSCGCALSFKMRSMSSECPLGFWSAEITEEEENELNKSFQ